MLRQGSTMIEAGSDEKQPTNLLREVATEHVHLVAAWTKYSTQTSPPSMP